MESFKYQSLARPNLPVNDVYIADDVDDWESAPVGRKVYPTYSELVTSTKDKIGYLNIGPWLYDQATEAKLSGDNVTATQAIDGVKEHGKKVIECLEYSLSYI